MILKQMSNKNSFFIPLDLVKEIENICSLTVGDLRLNDFDRGFKAGSLEIAQKIRAMYQAQENKNMNQTGSIL